MRTKSRLSSLPLLLADVFDPSPSSEETALPRARHGREIEFAPPAGSSQVSGRIASHLLPHDFDLVPSLDGTACGAEINFRY